jgi:protein-S-isoprenylcysteine O-methyltransferase Ste14
MNRLKTAVVLVALIAGLSIGYVLLSTRGWGVVNYPLLAINIVLFSLFFLFIPYKKKVARRQTSVYIAFVVALYIEMYGVPFTAYIFSWAFGFQNIYTLEFLLKLIIGQGAFYEVFKILIFPLATAIIVAGILLIIFGWREIFNGKGKLVTTGLYSRTRHPQYLGFLILTLGMNLEWTTIFTIILWPFLAVLYYKLANQEDKENEEQFGEDFLKYKKSVPSFFPRWRKNKNTSI